MKEVKEIRPLEYYLELDYPITIHRAEEGGYVVEIEDLPGCITEGETLEEAIATIDNVRQAWIETAHESAIDIPLPRTDEQYSGKFVVRLPKYLHRRLAERATREDVSLNRYVESILSQGVCADNISERVTAELEKLSGQIGIGRLPVAPHVIARSDITWDIRDIEDFSDPFEIRASHSRDQVAA